jgi:DNA polymerase-3 subunit epsilon
MLWRSPPWDSVTYWSLDLETGGLDPRHNAIVAVGMVPIRAGVIRLGDAYETLVRPQRATIILPDAVAVHELVPAEYRHAPSLAEVLVAVDARLAEGVLLVHNASVDVAFLKKAFADLGRPWPKPVVVDTVQLLFSLEKRRAFITPDNVRPDPELNLGAARAEHGLPAYAAHNALMDAISTAELFLVLRHKLEVRTLRQLR